MILPERKDAVHKAWLYRLVAAIYDNKFLAALLCFKGGTCAAMRGILDRFSVDLDFDFLGIPGEMDAVRKCLEEIFKDLNLSVKTKSERVPQYFLKYPNPASDGRNTLKIDVTTDPPAANRVEPVRLHEIDRIVTCQTLDTMFANKMVALIERYENRGTIAGRDLYDIHHFLLQGFKYSEAVIRERRHINNITQFLRQLIEFIEERITQTIINQDLNVLLPYKTFNPIRKTLKAETIMFLEDEINKWQANEEGTT